MRFFYALGYAINRAKFEYALGARAGFAPKAGDKEAKIVRMIKDNPGGNYVTAIKTHREEFSTSLRDAKDAVDALYVKHGIRR